MELLGLNTIMLKNGLKAEPGLSAFLSYPKSLRAALGISTTERRVMECTQQKTASPPQNLALGGSVGLWIGFTQITTHFSGIFLPKALTFYLFHLKLSSKAG